MSLSARLALLCACLLWAVSFIATKVALESTPPWTVVTLRLVISAACFLAWMGVTGSLRDLPPRRWLGPLVVLSLLGTGLHYGTQTVGLQYTSASNASLYAVTGPITIVLLGAALLRERLSGRKVLGVALALLGVLLVMGLDTLLALRAPARILGDLLVMLSIVMWGLFTVYGKKATDELGALRVTALVTVIGAACMLPVGWTELRLRGAGLGTITPDAWAAIAFLGVGCSFLATLLYFVALQRSESQKVGVYLYTIPPMTAIIAWLYLGERLGLGFLAGSGLVFAGVTLTERG